MERHKWNFEENFEGSTETNISQKKLKDLKYLYDIPMDKLFKKTRRLASDRRKMVEETTS